MNLNDWVSENVASTDIFEITVNGHMFRFKPLTNISVIAKAHERANELMEIVNGGKMPAWSKYAPLAEKPASLIAFMKAASVDVGDDALSDGVLLRMQAEAGILFAQLGVEFEQKCGFINAVVEEEIETSKND